MGELVGGSGAEAEGEGYLGTKNLGASVNILDVDQDPWPDFISVEGGFVFPQAVRTLNTGC